MKLEDWPEHVREFVPPGFDLEAYGPFKDFSAEEWYEQLLLRWVWKIHLEANDDFYRNLRPPIGVADHNHQKASQTIDMYISRNLPETFNETKLSFGAVSSARVQELTARLAGDKDVKQYLLELLTEPSDETKKVTSYYEIINAMLNNIVRVAGRMMLAAGRDDEAAKKNSDELGETLKELNKLLASLKSDDVNPMRIANLLNRLWDDIDFNPNGALVSVDLTAPSDKVEKDFRKWLDASKLRYAEQLTNARSFSKAQHFTEWAKSRVVPYIDIWLWNLQQGVDITDRQTVRNKRQVAAKLIFPLDSRQHNSDSVKTTFKWFEKLLDLPTLLLIRNQAEFSYLAETEQK